MFVSFELTIFHIHVCAWRVCDAAGSFFEKTFLMNSLTI